MVKNGTVMVLKISKILLYVPVFDCCLLKYILQYTCLQFPFIYETRTHIDQNIIIKEPLKFLVILTKHSIKVLFKLKTKFTKIKILVPSSQLPMNCFIMINYK
jgi:hypothetical protein